MTREEAKSKAEILSAYALGRLIEFKHKADDVWYFDAEGDLDMDFVHYDYRIKPAPQPPKYRAWTASEVPIGAMIRAIKEAYHFRSMIIGSNDKYFKYVGDPQSEVVESNFAYALNHFDHSTDGGKTWSPCGVLISEAQP